MNSGATAPEYGNAPSGDCVKLYSQTLSSNVGQWYIDNIWNDSIYSYYEYVITKLSTTNDSGSSVVHLRLNSATNTPITAGNYYYAGTQVSQNSGSNSVYSGGSFADNKFRLSGNNQDSETQMGSTGKFRIFEPQSSSVWTNYQSEYYSMHSNATTIYPTTTMGHLEVLAVHTGVTIYPTGGSIDAGTITVYGFKK